MTSMSPVSGSIEIDAPAEAVFDLLSDPRRHPEIDGSGTLQATLVGPERLVLGSRFGMSMRYWGLPYRITNEVVEFEPGRRIAWTHLSRVSWRYELEPLPGGGCRVTETWDPGRSPARAVYRLLGFPARTQAAIDGTLRTLKALAEQEARG
jgi:uncharacterized protein YndB with AHSA1/START domain